MTEVIQGIVVAVVAASLTAIGFLSRRWLTGARRHERAGLYSTLADLSGKMKQAGVSLDDLDAIEAQLRAKVRHADVAASAAQAPDRYWTQIEMNGRAFAAFQVAEAKMEVELVALSGRLDDEEQHKLDLAQAAWREYRDLHSSFVAGEYEGGSILPLIQASESTILTNERTAQLAAINADRQSRCG
tara:strand:+ start:9114 stop:9674 length:561 start_codon:yes stop_codon:yes gene_type:complete